VINKEIIQGQVLVSPLPLFCSSNRTLAAGTWDRDSPDVPVFFDGDEKGHFSISHA
jgi:hypothetical protein